MGVAAGDDCAASTGLVAGRVSGGRIGASACIGRDRLGAVLAWGGEWGRLI